VIAVASNPSPPNGVLSYEFVQRTPQILVQHWLSIRRSPTVCLPSRQVLRYALFEILRVRYQFHLAGFAQCLQSIYRRGQFHPVVSGLRFAS